MMMDHDPTTAQAQATGGGRLGRILLLADLASLPPALLRECLRDLLANMVSIADAAGALLNQLDPGTVAALQAATADGTLHDAYVELARRVEVFNVLADKVREISGEAVPGEDQFTLDIRVATTARLWALAAFEVKDQLAAVSSGLEHSLRAFREGKTQVMGSSA